MFRFKVYVPPFPHYNTDHIKVWEAVLEAEGRKLHIEPLTAENSKKCMRLGRGVGLPVLIADENGRETFLGTHYQDIVTYLQEQGLQYC